MTDICFTTWMKSDHRNESNYGTFGCGLMANIYIW